MPDSAVCAFCHGVRLAGTTSWIHATRFKPGERDGEEIRYDFCDDGCKKAWLDRGDQGLIGRIASDLYDADHPDGSDGTGG